MPKRSQTRETKSLSEANQETDHGRPVRAAAELTVRVHRQQSTNPCPRGDGAAASTQDSISAFINAAINGANQIPQAYDDLGRFAAAGIKQFRGMSDQMSDNVNRTYEEFHRELGDRLRARALGQRDQDYGFPHTLYSPLFRRGQEAGQASGARPAENGIGGLLDDEQDRTAQFSRNIDQLAHEWRQLGYR